MCVLGPVSPFVSQVCVCNTDFRNYPEVELQLDLYAARCKDPGGAGISTIECPFDDDSASASGQQVAAACAYYPLQVADLGNGRCSCS